MTYKLSVVGFKPDLRSGRGARIQKGFATKFLRVLTLVLLDAVFLTIAWKVAVFYGTPVNSPWTEKSSFLLLTLFVQLGIITAQGLYRSGYNRRNYPRLIKAVSLADIFLLFIAFLYEPSSYISRSTFLLFWLFSVTFLCLRSFPC